MPSRWLYGNPSALILRRRPASEPFSEQPERSNVAPPVPFFGTLKQELVAARIFTSVREAMAEVGAYLHLFHNSTRSHSTLDFHSPMEAENRLLASMSEAA